MMNRKINYNIREKKIVINSGMEYMLIMKEASLSVRLQSIEKYSPFSIIYSREHVKTVDR